MQDSWLKSVFLSSHRPRRSQVALAFICSIIACLMAVGAFGYSPGQDHFSAITLPGDDQWYANYVIKDQHIQDTDILYNDIGRSIANLRQADVVFIGTSRVLFAMDWRTADNFAQTHGIKFFNLAFAGVTSGEFTQRVIAKWNIHPRLWVADIYTDMSGFQTSFFNPAASVTFEAHTLAERGKLEAYANVVSLNLRWRAKMLFGLDQPSSYRSDLTGHWYLDKWPNRLRTDMPKMAAAKTDCPVPPEEEDAARNYAMRLKGSIVLTETPSIFSCYRRAQQIAAALGAPLFAPEPQDFSTTDGGGHLDGPSSAKYTHEFLDWLVQTPTFRQAMAR